MKKNLLILIILLLPLVSCDDGVLCDRVQLHTETYYMTDGLILNFQNAQNPEILSESIGLYMQYLIPVGDSARFAEQVRVLREHFIVNEGGYSFIRWKLGEDITVSAVIDDLRIAEALTTAAVAFREPYYRQLAEEIIRTVKSTMIVDGTPRDFFDWQYGIAFSEFFLSYYNVPLMEYFNFPDSVFAPLESLTASPFFPERFVNGEFLLSDAAEVNMIDQSLIAIAYFERMGYAEPNFHAFLEERFREDGVIFARYCRDTARNSNENQSSAVYAFLIRYFEITGQAGFAEKARGLLEGMDTGDAVSTHFFDFINREIVRVGCF